MNETALILGMFIVTFGVRYLLWGTAGRFHFPAWLSHALGFVPAAVLTAIIVPSVLMPDGQHLDLTLGNAYMLAAICALIIALWRNNLMLTILVGMTVFVLLKWVLLA
ncbi:MAG: branched-subunit amino acid transport protein [Motiliproteus sp.]|jgi:branched-subunit amino acid transport protein